MTAAHPSLSRCAAMLASVCALFNCAAADTVRLEIHVADEAFRGIPEDDRDLFVAGEFNNWDPDATPCAWSQNLGAYVAQFQAQPLAEFKITRGDWSRVEVSAEGADIANRTLDQYEEGEPTTQAVRVEGFADQRGSRWQTGEDPVAKQTVTGDLDIWDFHSDLLGNTRKIRVWLPPNYNDARRAYFPVMYMHDGQNLFDKSTSFIGEEWGVDETADKLIRAGEIPEMIIVGIDNAGADRPAEYNPPYTEWEGKPNRGDRYGRFLVSELMPEINRRYRTKTGGANTALGGSSFGANITLAVAMQYPEKFKRLLVESPAVWVQNEAIIDAVALHKRWDHRIFIAVGTDESSDQNRDKLYVRGTERLRDELLAAGLPEDQLKVVIEEGAQHSEPAWAKRLPTAFRFLFGS